MIQNFVKKFYIHDDNLPPKYFKIHHPLALKEQYTIYQISKSKPREICDLLQVAVSCQVRPRQLLSLACDFTATEENLFDGHHSISHFHLRQFAQWTLLNTGCSLG